MGSTLTTVAISLRDAAFLQEQPWATCVVSRMFDLSIALATAIILFRYTLSPLVGRVFAPLMMRVMFAPQQLPPAFLGLTIRPWQIRTEVADGTYMVPAAMSLSGRYREIRAPTQIIAGNNDKIVSPSTQSNRLHGVIQRSKLRILPETGHMVHYAMRDAVMEAIDEVAVESGLAPPSPAVA